MRFKRKSEGQNQFFWLSGHPATGTVAIPLMMWLAVSTIIAASHIEASPFDKTKVQS
jgi:hypothetical protein